MTKNNNKLCKQRPVKIIGGTLVAGAVPISGVVHVIRDEAEVQRFREGEILVAAATSPAWLEIFPLAKAIIAETDGWLSHAAVVARAYDIPGLIGVPQATEGLRSGDIITINSDGVIERLTNRREPDSPMRVSVPAAVTARSTKLEVSNQDNVVSLTGKPKTEGNKTDFADNSDPETGEGRAGNG